MGRFFWELGYALPIVATFCEAVGQGKHWAVYACCSFTGFAIAEILLNSRDKKMTWHIKLQPYALWIGAHYSQQSRRLCVNLLPCRTLCIVLAGGKIP